MKLSENILYLLTKILYKNLALEATHKEASMSKKSYNLHRISESIDYFNDLLKLDINFENKVVLDLGCSTGSIAQQFKNYGARKIIGIDIDEKAILEAKELNKDTNIEFKLITSHNIPLDDESVDIIVSIDVFEHVENVEKTLQECYRILKPSGKLCIRTWGWHHPYAPHLFSVMPVPWAHIFFSERTILRTCRKVYISNWYTPVYYDFNDDGSKQEGKYERQESISKSHVNKLLIRDFEAFFRKSPFIYKIYPKGFSHKFARWTHIFLRVPFIREFVTSIFYAILEKSSSRNLNK